MLCVKKLMIRLLKVITMVLTLVWTHACLQVVPNKDKFIFLWPLEVNLQNSSQKKFKKLNLPCNVINYDIEKD